MDALVRGYPSPLVTWSHDGLLLQNTWNNDSETSLLIRSVTVYQGGRYTCYAKNPFGDNIFTIDVYVKGIDFIPSSFIVACQERETRRKFAVLVYYFLKYTSDLLCHSVSPPRFTNSTIFLNIR